VITKLRNAVEILEKKEKTTPIIYNKFDVNQCEIYGYFFLTQPAHIKALDPVLIGCIFKNANKTYIRVKKLMYKINYLTQFIELDPDTGYYIDKFTKNQMTLGNPQKN
jgi:hypothetical protein